MRRYCLVGREPVLLIHNYLHSATQLGSLGSYWIPFSKIIAAIRTVGMGFIVSGPILDIDRLTDSSATGVG